LPPKDPSFIGKFNGIGIGPHHGKGPAVNFVAMPRQQLIGGGFVAALGEAD